MAQGPRDLPKRSTIMKNHREYAVEQMRGTRDRLAKEVEWLAAEKDRVPSEQAEQALWRAEARLASWRAAVEAVERSLQ